MVFSAVVQLGLQYRYYQQLYMNAVGKYEQCNWNCATWTRCVAGVELVLDIPFLVAVIG